MRSPWIALVLFSSCGIRFAACEPKRPELPMKLWTCDTSSRECTVAARFQNEIDCDLYLRFLGTECAPNLPRGEFHCWRTTGPYFKYYFHACSSRTLTYAEVRDGGGWIR